MNTSDEYMPVPLSTILVDTIIGCDLYIKNCEGDEIKYVLLCTGIKTVGQDKIDGLQKHNIENLYIHKSDHKVYLKYLEPCLKKIIKKNIISNTEQVQVAYNIAKNIMEDVFNDPRSGVYVERVKDWVSNTIDIIIREKSASAIIKMLSYDYYTYTHSVNVSVLGLLFSRYLNMKCEDMNALGVGLLLHDIGKTQVSSQIINKKGKLTDEEFREMKTHVASGTEILFHVGGIEDVAFFPVMQHHERMNGMGYPNGLQGNAIHEYGKIAAIMDVYDALTTRRSYSDARNPFAALKIMRDEMRGSFDEELFIDFILFLNQVK